jgi:flagellar motor switch protein FliG
LPSDFPSLPLPTLPSAPSVSGSATTLTQRQKAAVVVRLLLAEGASLPLDGLPEHMQEALTAEMGRMKRVDRDTLREVIEEFANELDSIGIHFPGGVAGAIGLLEDHLSPATAARLRREAGVAAKGDPWERIGGLAPERLVQVLEEESTEVGAVLLAKLQTRRAADLLSMLPGPRARELSYAISKTGAVDPETVRRIGLALASQLDAEPVRAFPAGPVQMVGDILNSTRSVTRDEVLQGLDEADAEFAEEVRRAIFTFANIPARIDKRDIPRIVKVLDATMLRTALARALADDSYRESAEFVLDNMSKRMADNLREEIEAADTPDETTGDEAMSGVIAQIRQMVENSEILLLSEG